MSTSFQFANLTYISALTQRRSSMLIKR